MSAEGNSAVDQQGIGTDFHGQGGITGNANSGIHHHWNAGLLNDQLDVGQIGQSLAAADGGEGITVAQPTASSRRANRGSALM